MRRMTRRVVAAAVGALLAAPIASPAQAVYAARPETVPVTPTAPDRVKPVKVQPFVPAADTPDPEAKAVRTEPARVAWPTAGAVTVDVAAGGSAKAGTLPIRVSPAAGASTRAAAPDRVEVAVRERTADGLLLAVRRADGKADRAPVTLTVDYSAFRDAYGGDWASRLSLAGVDGTATVADVRNDPAAGTVSARVSADPAGGVISLAAPPAGSTGDYKATSLSASGTWQVATQGGGFSWSYGMAVPPVPGGLEPEVEAAYSSTSVDGRVVATNNQPSWLGEGWDLWPGFIERSYKGCLDDLGGNNGQTKTGDLCWETDNATMSFGDRSARLVFSGGVWRPEDDDGTKVERVTRGDSAINGDNDGEYWRVTTPDGTRYHFGLNRLPGWTSGKAVTNSAWTVPVYGNDSRRALQLGHLRRLRLRPGLPLEPRLRRRPARQLDVVPLPHRDQQVRPEHGGHHRRLRARWDAVEDRVRHPVGRRVRRTGPGDGGLRRGGPVRRRSELRRPQRDVLARRAMGHVLLHRHVPGQVLAHVLVHPAALARHHQGPQWRRTVPRRRPVGLRPRVPGRSGLERDRALAQHRDPGGPQCLAGDHAASGAVRQPDVAEPGQLRHRRPARAVQAPDQRDQDESGGVITVNYANAECRPGALPAPDTNEKLCFPVRWAMPPAPEPVNDWFHKYVVASVVEDDTLTDADDVVTKYAYTGGGAWAYDDNPLVAADRRSWSVWRGFQNVTVTKGDPVNDEGKPLSRTDYLYFRGMHADRTASGGAKSVSVKDSNGVSLLDREPLAGFLREQITYDGATVVEGAINDPWIENHGTAGHLSADQVENVRTVNRTRMANGSYRKVRVDSVFDNYGNATTVNEWGDVDVAGDERCTTTAYSYNTGAMLVSLPSETTVLGVGCGAAVTYPADAVARTRVSYDNAAFGVAPVRGDATTTAVAKSYSGSTPTFLTTNTSTFDAFGRALTSTDPLGRKTTTAYAQTNGLTTSATVTNPLGHAVTTTVDPARGSITKTVDANGRTTSQAWDALGRLAKVHLPGRAEPDTPNLRFEYGVRNAGGPNYVRTDTLKANGNLVAGYEIFDGLLRSRQKQERAAVGGSVITDTRYDSRGLVSATTGAYHAEALPGPTLWTATPAGAIPSHTVNVYDGAERPTATIHMELNQEKWRTTTSYDGDNVTVVPPNGGTVTTTYKDARDRVTAVRQWHGRTATGSYDETRYGYTKRDEPAGVTDAAGNVWRYTYDVLGNKRTSDDPDAGISTMTYDDAGQLTSTTDARGRTIASVYDQLGRKVETHLGSAGGALLTKSVYDTLAKGALTSSTRYVDGKAYAKAITGYDAAGLPKGESVTIPSVPGEEALAKTYTTTYGYKPDGSIASEGRPALGDLPAETIVHGYNDVGLADTLTGALTYVTDTEYNGLNEVGQLELGAQGTRLWRTMFYEEGTRRISRALTERESTAGVAVNDLRYGYDPTGNVTRLTNWITGSGADSQCFGYDYLRRVTSSWTEGAFACSAAPSAANVGGPAPYWHQYGYDAIGNRRSQTVKGLGGAADVVRTYGYPTSGDGVDRPHALTSLTSGSTSASFTYDAVGNAATRPGPAGAADVDLERRGLARLDCFRRPGDVVRLRRRRHAAAAARPGLGDGLRRGRRAAPRHGDRRREGDPLLRRCRHAYGERLLVDRRRSPRDVDGRGQLLDARGHGAADGSLRQPPRRSGAVAGR